MLECLSIDGARELGDWISGARAVRGKDQGPAASAKTAPTHYGRGQGSRSARGYPRRSQSPFDEDDETPLARINAPEGFWEPEVPPYEDRSATSEVLSNADSGGTGIDGVDGEHPGAATIKIQLIEPGQVTLEMTKTSLPIWQHPKGDGRTRMETHTFTIITTTPRSAWQAKGQTRQITQGTQRLSISDEPARQEAVRVADQIAAFHPRTTILAAPAHSPRIATQSIPMEITDRASDRRDTPTEEIPALNLSQPQPFDLPKSLATKSRPLVFNRDGTINPHHEVGRRGKNEQGLPLDVHELLAHTDWTKTSLGPMESWPQSLKTIGE